MYKEKKEFGDGGRGGEIKSEQGHSKLGKRRGSYKGKGTTGGTNSR